MKSKFRYFVEKKFIDLNGHLTEWGYYAYATQSIWDLNEAYGLLKLYQYHDIGPIIFDTNINFFTEVFYGEEIIAEPRIVEASHDLKKFKRVIKIFNQKNIVCAKFVSNGAFLNHKTRKVDVPPEPIRTPFKKLVEKIAT